jgi:hypothetical protein
MKYYYDESNNYPHILLLDADDEIKLIHPNSKLKSVFGDGKPIFKNDIKQELDQIYMYESGMVKMHQYTIFYLAFKSKKDAIAWKLVKE